MSAFDGVWYTLVGGTRDGEMIESGSAFVYVRFYKPDEKYVRQGTSHIAVIER